MSTYSPEFTSKVRSHLREQIIELLDEIDPGPATFARNLPPERELCAAVREYLSLEEGA